MIRKAGHRSVSEFIRKTTLSEIAVSKYSSLAAVPYDAEKGVFKPNALAIAAALNCTVWDIFPLHHIDIPLEQSDMDFALSLDDVKHMSDVSHPEQVFIDFDRKKVIADLMGEVLTEREVELLDARYRYEISLRDLENDFGITNQAIVQVEQRALKKMLKAGKSRLKDVK